MAIVQNVQYFIVSSIEMAVRILAFEKINCNSVLSFHTVRSTRLLLLGLENIFSFFFGMSLNISKHSGFERTETRAPLNN